MSAAADSISSGWPTVPLGEIAEIKLGKMLDRAKHITGRKLPYLRNINVRWGSIETDDVLEMHFEDPQVERFGLKDGDVLVCEGGEPGRAAVWMGGPTELKFQKALHRVRFKVPYEPGLLVYLLELLARSGGLERRFTGSTIKHFTREAFLQLPIPLLPVHEQQRIVAEIEKHFTRLDSATGSLRRVGGHLSRYRASVLKAAVERPFEGRDRTQWATVSMRDALLAVEAGRSFRCDERTSRPDEVGVIKVSAVTWGTYDEEETKTCLDASRIEPRFFIQSGDFLFSRANTIDLIGACVIAERVTKPVMLSDKILRFKFAPNVAARWVLYWLRSERGRDEIKRLATGNQESMRNIGQDRIRQITIDLPPLAEQHRIVAEVERRLSVIDELKRVVDANLQRVKNLRQSILQRAFSGQL